MGWVLAHSCNPSTWEAKAGRSEVQDQCAIHSKLRASLGYVLPFVMLCYMSFHSFNTWSYLQSFGSKWLF